MNILINGSAIDFSLDGEKTAYEVVTAIKKECEQRHAKIIGVELDGTVIDLIAYNGTEEELDAISENPLKSAAVETVKELSVTTATLSDVIELLKKRGEQSRELAQKAANLSVLLQSGKQQEGLQFMCTLADTVDAFCDAIKLTYLFDNAGATSEKESASDTPPIEHLIGGKSKKDFFADFNAILNDFCDAQEKNDIVTLGDISEYEIQDRLLALSDYAQEL
ncbi:MAG: hypothetical protein Ta2A_03990 [Treponemataceae bacterium]|nr:MAG: hypothetical protein Ta2A_03990 [Treponemataceae bacterium]